MNCVDQYLEQIAQSSKYHLSERRRISFVEYDREDYSNLLILQKSNCSVEYLSNPVNMHLGMVG